MHLTDKSLNLHIDWTLFCGPFAFFWLVKQIKITMGVFAYDGFEVVIIVIGIRGKNSLCVHDCTRRNSYIIIIMKKEEEL